MTDKKLTEPVDNPNRLTDSEIVKALECCCKNNNCEGCPLDYLTFSSQCASELAIKSLDLINRLQAQNKDLSETVHNLIIEKDDLFDKAEELKAEVERLNTLVKTKNKLIKGLYQSINYAYDREIKEFAERLKNEIINDTAYACDSTQHSGYYDYQIKIGDIPEYIDNLVKEMVGEDK